eukprot:603120-Pelagomonas_calceolata.AAC.1
MSVIVQRRGHFLLGGMCPSSKGIVNVRSPISSDAKLAGGGQIYYCVSQVLWLCGMLCEGYQSKQGSSFQRICHPYYRYTPPLLCRFLGGGWLEVVFNEVNFLDPKLAGACDFDICLWVGEVLFASSLLKPCLSRLERARSAVGRR